MTPILIPVIVLVLVVVLAAMVTGIFNKLVRYRPGSRGRRNTSSLV